MNFEEVKAPKYSINRPQKVHRTHIQVLINYLLLLRYGTETPIEGQNPILNIKSVSEVCRIKYSTVRGLLKLGLSLLTKHMVA
jgi:hypothetical protein